MANVDRVTVTLPSDLVRDIDRREKNRSKFVAEAVRNELDRRRRDELRRSLHNPHAHSHRHPRPRHDLRGPLHNPPPESTKLAGRGLEEGTRALPGEDPANPLLK